MKKYIARIFLIKDKINLTADMRRKLHIINSPYIELDVFDDQTFTKPITNLDIERIVTSNVFAFLGLNKHLFNEVDCIKIYDQYEDKDVGDYMYRVLQFHSTLENVKFGYEKWLADNQDFQRTFFEVQRREGTIVADLIYEESVERVYTLTFNPDVNSIANIVNAEQYKNLILETMANSNTIAKDVVEDICVSVFEKGIYYPAIHITKKEKKENYWDEYIKKNLVFGKT